MDREYLADVHPEVILLEPSELDAAIIGVVEDKGEPRVVYSRRKLIECFEDQGMEAEAAEEWYEFNVAGAYLGPNTPLYLDLEWGD